MIEHREVCNLMVAQKQSLNVQPESRILQFASFSFDACIFEIIMALCQGASLQLPPTGAVLAGKTLLQILARNASTHVTLPPIVLAALPEQINMDSVSTLIVACDAPSSSLVKRWARGRRFINAYGPTEATVWATLYDCNPEEFGFSLSDARLRTRRSISWIATVSRCLLAWWARFTLAEQGWQGAT